MSARLGLLCLALLAAVLLAALGLELGGAQTDQGAGGLVPLRHETRTQPRVASEEPDDHTGAWATTALARPLFSRDRKPTPMAARAGGAPVLASLPRLTGVVVGPFGRTAIFAGAQGGRPIAVNEGKTLGPYRIEAIAPGGVTVAGPDGEQHVSLAADAATRDSLAAEMPQPPPGQVGVRGLPPGVPQGTPLNPQQRQNMLNFRPGAQFQRSLNAPQIVQPNVQGSN